MFDVGVGSEESEANWVLIDLVDTWGLMLTVCCPHVGHVLVTYFLACMNMIMSVWVYGLWTCHVNMIMSV